MSLLEQAQHLGQYDVPGMDWASVGGADSPHRQLMSRAINLDPTEVYDAAVLDIGCGTGWFLAECLSKGAASADGIEPSNYAAYAQEAVPQATVTKTSFADYVAEKPFDFVSLVMVSEHLAELPAVFQKVQQLLTHGGRLLILAADYDAFLLERYDYELTTEIITPNTEAVIQTKRPNDYGTTTDIVRSVDYWLATATAAGFKTIQQKPVPADGQFMAQMPKYKLFRNHPLFQLFRFEKA